MISRQLIDLLNSGEAVSVVGSGISTDAGIPTWNGLFNSVADSLDREQLDTQVARATATEGKLPEAFDLLASLTNKSDIHRRISTLIERVSIPGKYHVQLADWPFRFHVTTNYDHLIEDAATEPLVSVGNHGSELHKVAGGSRDFVWHLHGACRLGSDTSKLVVTKSDYEDLYPSSNVVDRLKAIATAYRCVFLGFGFQDEDLTYVLKTVGRLAPSGRPSFAFIGYEDRSDRAKQHQESLLENYNVEVIPYIKQDGSHTDLQRVLEGYAPFVVRHSISLGQAQQATPTYDPMATSLRIQSSLDIGMSDASDGLRKTLVVARVLAHIRENPGGQDDGLESLYRSGDPSQSEVLECVEKLRESGAVTSSPTLDITPDYRAKTEVAIAKLDLTRDQFRSSLRVRILKRNPDFKDSSLDRVSDTSFAFLDKLCRERGLGVAQNLVTSKVDQASRRTVSLVQNLPDYLSTCTTRDEAFSVVHLVADILTRPTEAETRFLGLLCQAYFGQHLVGATKTLAEVDLNLISDTCYVLDASVLVCLLSEGSKNHEFAKNLIRDLVNCGAIITTTSLFLEETAEHAQWAARLIDRHGEHPTKIFDVLFGRGGYRPNQFLHGYIQGSPPDANFSQYLGRMLEMGNSNLVTDKVVAARLTSLGVQSLSFSEWEGFDQDCRINCEDARLVIERRRYEQRTYKHHRQTQAEAEVAIIVDGVRTGKLQPPGAKASDSFFISSTRAVDGLPGLERRICLLPEGLAQWLWSSQATSTQHAKFVFQQLLWELAQGGVAFVDRTTLLRRFSGVIEVAETELKALISSRRDCLVEKYGPDPEKAFRDVDPLDLPRLAEEVRQEAQTNLEAREARAEAAEKRAREAEEAARISEKERDELVKLQAKQKQKHLKARRKRRGTKSKSRKKGRRQ